VVVVKVAEVAKATMLQLPTVFSLGNSKHIPQLSLENLRSTMVIKLFYLLLLWPNSRDSKYPIQ